VKTVHPAVETHVCSQDPASGWVPGILVVLTVKEGPLAFTPTAMNQLAFL
jgi:hypothetical protein